MRRPGSERAKYPQPEAAPMENDEKIEGLIRRGRLDPVLFAEDLLGVSLHDGQKMFLWLTTHTGKKKCFKLGVGMGMWATAPEFEKLWALPMKRNILVPANRWGKTVVLSVKHIWTDFYKIGIVGDPEIVASKRCGSLNLSPHSNQVTASFDYIVEILESRFVWNEKGRSKRNRCRIGWFLSGYQRTQRRITFSNNTTWAGIPTGEDQGGSLAGTTYLYVSYDECAQSLHLRAELPAKILSRVIDVNGAVDLVSTPEVDKPSHQYYMQIVKKGQHREDGWFAMVGKMSDNTFLSADEMELASESIKKTDPIKWRQVFLGEFVAGGKRMFPPIVVERLFDRAVPEVPLVAHEYLISIDWGFADSGDPTIFYIIDYTNAKGAAPFEPRYRIAYRESIRGGSPFALVARAKLLQREWQGARIIHDAQALGGVMLKKMMREMEITRVTDFHSQGNTGLKSEMLFSLVTALTEGRRMHYEPDGSISDENKDFGKIRSYLIPELMEQLGNYAYNPATGVTDKRIEQDEVMALGMGIWCLEKEGKTFKPKAIVFNPFGDNVDQIFGQPGRREIPIRSIVIPESRIM